MSEDIAKIAAGLTKAQRACFDLVAGDHPMCVPADDSRLEPFCDDREPIDTINQCFDLGIIRQLGCGDFDDFRTVLTPLGLAVRQHLQDQSA